MAEKVQAEHGPKKKKSLPILWVVGIVVLAAALGAGLRWWQLDSNAKKAAKPTVVEQKAFDSQNAVAAGNFDAAHKQLEEALDNSHLSIDERYTLTTQQGVTFENEKNYKEALKKYQDAEALKKTQDIAESIGRVSEADGNKEMAIAAYKRATSRISKDSPIAESDKDRYAQMIRNLGGQP